MMINSVEEMTKKDMLIEVIMKEVMNGKMKISEKKLINIIGELIEKNHSFRNFFQLNHQFKTKHLHALIKNSTIIQVPSNYCIFKHGSTVQEFLCLISGQITIKIPQSSIITDTSIKSKLMNEYNLITEPTIIYSDNHQLHHLSQSNNNNNSNTFRKRRSSSCIMFYEINLQNRLKRGNIFSNPPIIKSGIFNKTKKLITPISLIEDHDEIEQMTIENQCFINNWNIINNLPHYSTAFSKGNCILLCLDVNIFHKVIERPLHFAENERKMFISSRIKTLSKLTQVQFDDLYHKFILTYHKKNDIIITNEQCTSSLLSKGIFYLIYKGQCSIQPMNYHKNVLHFSSGDFINLEALFKAKGNNCIYRITSTSIDTILIRFDIKLFNAVLIKEIKEELLEYYKQKEQIYNDITRRTATLRHKFKKSYKNLANGSMCSVMQTDPHNQSDNNMKKTITANITIANIVSNKVDSINQKCYDNVKNEIRMKRRLRKFNLKQKVLLNDTNSHLNHLMNMSTTFRSNEGLEEKNSKIINMKVHSSRVKLKQSILKIPIENRRYCSKKPTTRSTNSNSNSTSFNNIPKDKDQTNIISAIVMKPIESLQKKRKPILYSCLINNINNTLFNWSKTLHNSKREFETETYKIPLISNTIIK